MTPLQDDSGYLYEVTQCLSQGIVHLLQTRPTDPIEFLAQSLRHHRRLHPRPIQGKGSQDTVSTNEEQTNISPRLPNSHSRESNYSFQQVNPSQQQHGIVKSSEIDDGVAECGEHYGELQTFVHKDSVAHILAIGDLFDDDDFG